MLVGAGLIAMSHSVLRKTPQHDHRRRTHCGVHAVRDVDLAITDVTDDVTHIVSRVDGEADLCQSAGEDCGGVGACVEQENDAVTVAGVPVPNVEMRALLGKRKDESANETADQ